MTDARDEGTVESGPPLPHTPPAGIKAVRPGDEPPVAPSEAGPVPRERPASNWPAAMAASVGVVAAIIGTFLPWMVTEGAFAVEEIGWDRGADAVLVLAAGLVAAGVAGSLWTGVRGRVVEVLLSVTGVALVVIAGLEMGDVAGMASANGFEFSIGSGLPVITVGGVLLMAAALLDRAPWRR
jgi:hypothetical protein